jgi:hypothetical protein
MFPVFGDIDKKPVDALKKDFVDPKKAPFTLKTNVKGPFGSKITTTIDYLTDGGLSAILSGKYSTGTGFNVDKLEMSGNNTIKTETSLEGGGVLPPGLKLEFKGDNQSSGEMTGTFENDMVTAQGSIDMVDFKSAALSVCSGAGALNFGASADIDLGGANLADYAAGLSYTMPGQAFASMVMSNKLSKALFNASYTASPELTILGQTTFNKSLDDIKFGCVYKCNPDTTIKVKADTKGALATSVKQQVAPGCEMTGMASLSLAKVTDVSFGASVTLG